MATKTKHATQKAFIDLGKVPIVQADGSTKQEQEYVVISEDLAKYIGAKYTTVSPAPKQVTTKGKKTFTREVSVRAAGRPHKIGYADGTTGTAKSRKVKIKWVTIHIPKGAKLRTYIDALMSKVTKKPVYLKMPSGKVTRLLATK